MKQIDSAVVGKLVTAAKDLESASDFMISAIHLVRDVLEICHERAKIQPCKICGEHGLVDFAGDLFLGIASRSDAFDK